MFVFLTFGKIFKHMKTIVISLDNDSNVSKLIDAIKLFKGVKKVSLPSEEELENISMLKACKNARKSKNISKETILETLK